MGYGAKPHVELSRAKYPTMCSRCYQRAGVSMGQYFGPGAAVRGLRACADRLRGGCCQHTEELSCVLEKRFSAKRQRCYHLRTFCDFSWLIGKCGTAPRRHVSPQPKNSSRKSEARAVLGKLAGLWRPFNNSLKERMSEFYRNISTCAHAHAGS